jgi:hypothetical protein
VFKIKSASLVETQSDSKIQEKIKLREEKKKKLEELYRKITEIN